MKYRSNTFSVGIQVCLSTLLSVWTSAHAALNDGLELYYPFESNGGSVTADVSGNGRNGTVYNAQWRGGGPQGGYMAFDGNGDYINVGTAINFPMWSQFSLSVWFLNDGGGDNTGYGQKLIDKTSFGHDAYIRIAADSEAGKGAVQCIFNEGGVSGACGSAVRVRGDGTWHHFAVVRNGSTLNAWLDGVLVPSYGTMPSVNSASPLYIGYSASSDSYQRRYWSGYVDEVRIYNRTLSQSEIAQLAAGLTKYQLTVASPVGTPTPAVGSSQIEEGSNVTAQVASPVLEGDSTRHVCTGWTGTGSVPAVGPANSVAFTITNDSTIAWQWRTEHRLVVEADAGGTASGGGWHTAGSSVLIEAAAEAGFAFVGWSDGSSEPSRYVTVTAGALAYNAQFAATAELHVLSPAGEPTPSRGIHRVTVGATVAARVPASYTFGSTRQVCSGWLGTGSVPPAGSSNSVSFTLARDSSLAWYWASEALLNLQAGDGGAVIGGGWYAPGSFVSVLATPNLGYRFAGWSDGSAEAARWILVPALGASYSARFQVAPIDTVRFRQGAVSVDESTGEVFLTLERIGAARTAAAVTCKPRPASARSISDFVAAGVKVAWAAGDVTEKRIRIPIVADKVPEPAETFTVELLNPSSLIFGEPRTATVTILSQLPVLTGAQPLSVGVLDRGGEQ